MSLKPSVALKTKREAVRRIVNAHRADHPRIFGSVAAGSDHEESDLDILIDPLEGMTLLDLGAIRHELEALLKIPVDVLTPNAIPESFRANILAEARPL